MLLRDEAIKLMSDHIDNMNRQMGMQHGVPESQIEEQLSQQRPQMMYVNGLLFDLLLEHGYINTSR